MKRSVQHWFRSVKENLRDRLSGLASGRRSPAGRLHTQLGLEPLESREVFDVTATIAAGVLMITTDSANDLVLSADATDLTLTTNSPGAPDNDVNVVGGTAPGTAVGSKTILLSDFTSIVVQSGAGVLQFSSVNIQGSANFAAEKLSVDAAAVDFTTGALSVAGLTVASDATVLLDFAITSSQDVSVQSDAAITISAALNAAGKSATLNAGGILSQNAAGVITASKLTASGTLVQLLGADNKVGAVSGTASAGSFNFRNDGDLTVDAAISAQTTLRIDLSGANDELTLAGDLTSADTILLQADAFDLDGTKTIQAPTVTIGTFTSGTDLDVGAPGLSDAELNALSGVTDLTFVTAGAASKITVSSLLVFSDDVSGKVEFRSPELDLKESVTAAATGTLRLTTDDLTLAAGKVFSAGTIEFVSDVDISFTSAAAAGGMDFSQADLEKLDETVVQTVRFNTSGAISFDDGPIDFTTNVTKADAAIVLRAVDDPVTQKAGATFTAANLAVRGTSVTLLEDNTVGVVAGQATTGNFSLKSTSNLSVGAVDAAGLGATGVTAATTAVLTSNGLLTQTAAGVVTATSLAARGDAIDLSTATNKVSTFAAKTTGGTAIAGDVRFLNGGANLSIGTVDGITGIEAAADPGDASKLALVAIVNDQAITLDQAIDDGAGGQVGVVLLNSTAGTVSQAAAGVITALKVAASGDSVVLNAANLVSQLSGQATGAAATDDFQFTSNLALTVIDDTAGTPAGFNGVKSTAGDVILTTGGTDQNLTLNAAVQATATDQTVKLVSSGAVSQNAAGVITATTVAASGDSVLLTAANQVSKLSGRATGAADADDFQFTSNLALEVINDAGTPVGFDGVASTKGDVILTTGGTDQDLTLTAAVTVSAPGQTLKLVSSGDVTQTAAISAAIVAVSGDSVTLTAAANAVVNLSGEATTGNFKFHSNSSLNIHNNTMGTPTGFNGVVSTAGSVELTTPGNLTVQSGAIVSAFDDATLTADLSVNLHGQVAAGDVATITSKTGVVSQPAGSISAGTLSVTADDDIALLGAVVAGGAATFTATTGEFNLGAPGSISAAVLTITADDAVGINGAVTVVSSAAVSSTTGNVTQGAAGVLTLGLADGTIEAKAGNVTLLGTTALTANSTTDLGTLTITTKAGNDPTVANLLLDFNVPVFLQGDVFTFVTLATPGTKLAAPNLSFNTAGSPATILQSLGATVTVLLGGSIVNFNIGVGSTFALQVADTPVDVTGLFVIQNAELTVPAVAPAIAPTVYNTTPDVEQDVFYGQQTNLAGLTVFVKLYSVVNGKKVWVIGGVEKDKDGQMVEAGDPYKGNEVLPKLIAVFTETISGKWGDYTLELEEVAPEKDGEKTVRATRVVKATFKFNVKTQSELIEALRNIQTIEKLFQYFQELPSRGAAPDANSSEGGAPAARRPRAADPAQGEGASLFDSVRNQAAKLAQAAPAASVHAAQAAAYLRGAAADSFIVEVSADASPLPTGDLWETSEAESAGASSIVAGFAGAALAASAAVAGRRRKDDPFERDLDSWMAVLADRQADWF